MTLGLLNGTTVPLVAVGTLVISCGTRLLRGRFSETHKRGVIVRCAGSIRRAGRFANRRASTVSLRLANVALESSDECRHFKLIGATGAGKSTAIGELLRQALDRGDRALFVDPDASYYDQFFRRYRGDTMMNPFERGSVRWDPFREIQHAYDVEQLAIGLIPHCPDPAANEWRGYARTFLCAVVRRCLEAARPDCGELWRLVAMASIEELRSVLAGTPAQAFLDGENARMFGSIRSVTVASLAALEHIQLQRAVPFSIKKWVGAERTASCLFLPYSAQQIAALRALIATWVRLAVFEALSGVPQHDQRLWFVVDELDALGAIDGLKDALARLRKFGGRCVLGFQSIAQVSSLYGPGDAQTIVENCGNTLILRCSSSEQGGTSHFASRLIGEREIRRKQVTRNLEGPFAGGRPRRSRNLTEQHVTETAVLASEIEQLPDLCGYFKRASAAHWLKVSFAPRAPRARSSRHRD